MSVDHEEISDGHSRARMETVY